MRRLRAECAGRPGRPTGRWRATCSRRPTRPSRRSTPATPTHLREELGDLLLQVYFHAVIAEEAGEFTIDDVAADIIAKMHRRNPHVFGRRRRRRRRREINEAWEAIKATEKQRDLGDRRDPADAARRCCTPTRCSTGSTRAGAGRPVEPAGDDLGDRLLALVAEAREPGSTPSRRCATPCDGCSDAG